MKLETISARVILLSRIVVVSALACVALAACKSNSTVADSVALNDLNQEWARLYEDRLKAERDQPGSGARLNDALSQLAGRAESRGDATAPTNPADAVGFYRIAATAAWSAGPPRNTRLIDIEPKGTAACAKLPNGPASAPRDCAFIAMAPSLAALDQEVRGAGTLSPADQAKAEASIKRMSSLIKRVVAARSTSGSQSESFTEYVALNLNRAFCTLQGLFGRLANSSPPAEQMERARSAAVAAQTTLREAAISTACN